MNFRHFGNKFKHSSNVFGGARNFRSYGSSFMSLRMAQQSVYQYQLGAFMGTRGIMGTPALMTMMLQSRDAAQLAMFMQGSEDLLLILKNELMLDCEDDTL